MIAITKCNKANLSSGFSLVEVAMALAIMGFACVALIGMIPMGLTSFHQAMGNTIESEIVQNLTNDMLLANFSDLYQYSYTNSSPTGQTYYYNNEGSPVTGGTPPAGTVYTVVVTLSPISSSNSPAGLTANGISTATTTNGTTFSGLTSAYNVIITIASSPSTASYTSSTGSSVAAFLSAYATGTATGVTHPPDQYCFVIANNNL